MSKMHCGIVYCAMFQGASHAIKILRPTPHWEKQAIQSVSTTFYMYWYFLLPEYYYISLGYSSAEFRKGVKWFWHFIF